MTLEWQGVFRKAALRTQVPRGVKRIQIKQQYLPTLLRCLFSKCNQKACFSFFFFFIQLFGHENVSVMDGGLAKWKGDGFETTTALAKKKVLIVTLLKLLPIKLNG